MKVLLIGGAPNTGKSNAVTMCANYLLNKNFKVIREFLINKREDTYVFVIGLVR